MKNDETQLLKNYSNALHPVFENYIAKASLSSFIPNFNKKGRKAEGVVSFLKKCSEEDLSAPTAYAFNLIKYVTKKEDLEAFLAINKNQLAQAPSEESMRASNFISLAFVLGMNAASFKHKKENVEKKKADFEQEQKFAQKTVDSLKENRSFVTGFTFAQRILEQKEREAKVGRRSSELAKITL